MRNVDAHCLLWAVSISFPPSVCPSVCHLSIWVRLSLATHSRYCCSTKWFWQNVFEPYHFILFYFHLILFRNDAYARYERRELHWSKMFLSCEWCVSFQFLTVVSYMFVYPAYGLQLSNTTYNLIYQQTNRKREKRLKKAPKSVCSRSGCDCYCCLSEKLILTKVNCPEKLITFWRLQEEKMFAEEKNWFKHSSVRMKTHK